MKRQKWDTEPGTPVIVKTGGNQTNGPLVILSPEMPFVTFLGSIGEGWKKAVSTAAGRICMLEFDDGDLSYQFNISSRPNVLTSLEVHQQTKDGTQLFEISEESANDSIRLHIKSSISFKIKTERGPGEWEESETPDAFSGNDIRIVFKQTNTSAKKDEMSLEYTFSSADFQVILYFPPLIN